MNFENYQNKFYAFPGWFFKKYIKNFGDFDEYKRCAFDRLSTKSHSPMFFFCGTQDNVGFPLTTQTRFAQ